MRAIRYARFSTPSRKRSSVSAWSRLCSSRVEGGSASQRKTASGSVADRDIPSSARVWSPGDNAAHGSPVDTRVLSNPRRVVMQRNIGWGATHRGTGLEPDKRMLDFRKSTNRERHGTWMSTFDSHVAHGLIPNHSQTCPQVV